MKSGKKVLVGIILMLVLVPVFVFAQTTPAEAQTEVPEDKFSSIRNIQEAVREYTPGFITKPFLYVINKLEGIRTGLLNWAEKRRFETKSHLNDAEFPLSGTEEEDVGTANEEVQEEIDGIMGELRDAFRYLEIFLLLIFIFALSFKLIFYGFLVFLLLLISRFFWYRFY